MRARLCVPTSLTHGLRPTEMLTDDTATEGEYPDQLPPHDRRVRQPADRAQRQAIDHHRAVAHIGQVHLLAADPQTAKTAFHSA